MSGGGVSVANAADNVALNYPGSSIAGIGAATVQDKDVVFTATSLDSNGRVRFASYDATVHSLSYSSESPEITGSFDLFLGNPFAVGTNSLTIDINDAGSGDVSAIDFSKFTTNFIGVAANNVSRESVLTVKNSAGNSARAAIALKDATFSGAKMVFETNAAVSGDSFSMDSTYGFGGIIVNSGSVDWNVASTTLKSGTSFTVADSASFTYNGSSDLTLYGADVSGILTFNGSNKLTIDTASFKNFSGTLNYNSSADLASSSLKGFTGTLNYNGSARYVNFNDFAGTLNHISTENDMSWNGGVLSGTLVLNGKDAAWTGGSITGTLESVGNGRMLVMGEIEVSGKVNSSIRLDSGKLILSGENVLTDYNDKASKQNVITIHNNSVIIENRDKDNMLPYLLVSTKDTLTQNINFAGIGTLGINAIEFVYEGEGKLELVVSNYRDKLLFLSDNIYYLWDDSEKFGISITDVEGNLYTKDSLSLVSGSFNGVDGWFVSTVPEPATYAAIFGALALAFAAYRRKRA